MHLLHGLAKLAMDLSFHFKATHLLGRENVEADALLQNHVSAFFALTPQVQQPPTAVFLELKQRFLHQQPDWLFTIWRDLFSSFL